MSDRELKVHLRPVCLPDDEQFLRDLYASRRDDLRMLPLDPSQLAGLINMQYEAQDHGYRAEFPMAEHYIVEVDNVPAGRFLIDRSGESRDAVIDIAITPENRGRGAASRILKDALAEARRAGKGLTLEVAPTNPALQLYLRLGGEIVSGNQTSVTINWPATDSGGKTNE